MGSVKFKQETNGLNKLKTIPKGLRKIWKIKGKVCTVLYKYVDGVFT